jgi:hypothetical protein
MGSDIYGGQWLDLGHILKGDEKYLVMDGVVGVREREKPTRSSNLWYKQLILSFTEKRMIIKGVILMERLRTDSMILTLLRLRYL